MQVQRTITPKTTQERIAEIVLATRERLGWSQDFVAGKAKIKVPTLRNLEQTGECSARTIISVCDVLGISNIVCGGVENYLDSATKEDIKQNARQKRAQ